jgi:hypothetical protein
MLVMNETGLSEPKRVTIGETVKITATSQVGEVIGYASGKWQVRTTDGNVVDVTESQIETRKVLLG